MSSARFTRDEVLAFAHALVKAMSTSVFVEQLKDGVRRAPVPDSDDALVERLEQVQGEYLAHDYASRQSAAGGGAALDGAAAMLQLREAVTVYADKEVEEAVTQLCMATEQHMVQLINVMPELQHLKQQHENEMRNHSHSGHGAGADGATSGGGNMLHDPQAMGMMQMALRTLTPQQRGVLERMQRAMMQGRQPTPEDMQEMQQVQQHITAFMQTMSQFASSGGKSGATA